MDEVRLRRLVNAYVDGLEKAGKMVTDLQASLAAGDSVRMQEVTRALQSQMDTTTPIMDAIAIVIRTGLSENR